MSNLNQITARLDSVLEKVRQTALKTIEIEGKKSIQLNFIEQGRPKWLQKKKKDGRAILTGKTGRLQSQINVVRNDATNTISIGSNLPYSKIQQEGGTISMPARTMARRKLKNGRSVFASKKRNTGKSKSVDVSFSKAYTITIPARPYLVIPSTDYSRITSAVESSVKRVIT